MDYLEYSLWRSWLVCGVAGQQVLMTGCKTEEAAAALLRPADGIQGIANKGNRGYISHISVQLARFLHRMRGVAFAWPFEALSRGHQAVWRDGDAIAHEPTAARALMSLEHGHGPAM